MSHTDTNHTIGTQDFESDGVAIPWTDLVGGVEVIEPPTGPQWTPDNTLFSLSRYIFSLALPLHQHSMALAIANYVSWNTGQGCFAGLDTLARESRLTERAASRALAALVTKGIIGRKRTLTGNSMTRINLKVALHNATQEADTTTPIPANGSGSVPASGSGANQLPLTNPTAEREFVNKLSLSGPRDPGRARKTRQWQSKPSTNRHVKERETQPNAADPTPTIDEMLRREALRQEALGSGRRG